MSFGHCKAGIAYLGVAGACLYPPAALQAAPAARATQNARGAADAPGETAIRARLSSWVMANNAQDADGMRAIWKADAFCWQPVSVQLSNGEASRLAGSAHGARSWSTYELQIDRIDVSGPFGVVHDIWSETRHFADTGVTVFRRVRRSELWAREPGDEWKIVRCVSAPDPWRVDGQARGGEWPASLIAKAGPATHRSAGAD